MIKELLGAGADLGIPNKEGETAMALMGNVPPDIVEEILDNCSCKPFFLNWQAKSTRVENSASLPFCTGPGLLCMKNKMNMWGDENRKMDRVIHYSFFFEHFLAPQVL